MKFPRNMFPYRHNADFHEPECIQHKYGPFCLSWNPDDNRFYVEQDHGQDDDHDWTVLATFAGNAKGYQNAVQYLKKAIQRG